MKEETKTVEDKEIVEETGNTVTQTERKTEEEVEKTFTQEEVNSYLKKEKAKILKDIPSKEELKVFKEWQEEQKTAEQKQAEKETQYQKTLLEKQNLVQENQVLKAGVNTEDVDYVVFKVSKLEGEFNENLTQFLKENPKYLGQKFETEQKATGTPVKTISSKESGVMAILKAKYPEIYKE